MTWLGLFDIGENVRHLYCKVVTCYLCGMKNFASLLVAFTSLFIASKSSLPQLYHGPLVDNLQNFIVFDNCLKFYKKKYNLTKKIPFKHGVSYLLPNDITLIPCYHPSPRNVNTKIISEKMMVALIKKAKKISTIWYYHKNKV